MSIDNIVKRTDQRLLPVNEEIKSLPSKEADAHNPEALKAELQKDADLLKVLQDRGLIAKSDPIYIQIESALKDLDDILNATGKKENA